MLFVYTLSTGECHAHQSSVWSPSALGSAFLSVTARCCRVSDHGERFLLSWELSLHTLQHTRIAWQRTDPATTAAATITLGYHTVIAEWLAVECTCLLHIGPPWPSNFITSICSGLVVRVVSALLHGNWQDFNWHDASRGPSAIAELLGFTRLSCKTKAYDQSKSSEKIRYGTISPFQNCVCEGGSWNGKSGAEAVFVYATRAGISTSRGILVGRQRWLTHQFVARR